MSQQPPGGPPPHGPQTPHQGPPPGQPHGPQPGGYGVPVEMSPADQRLWGMLAHLSGLVSAFFALSFIGPMVIFLVLKDRGVFVRRQAAEALNFQILIWAVLIASTVLTVVTFGLALIVVLPLGGALAIVALVFIIIAAVQANQGVDYRYPVNWRLVK